MKLAVIVNSSRTEDLFAFTSIELQRRGVELDVSYDLEEFEEEHGTPSNYDGLLMHPGRGNYRRYIEKVTRKYPKLKFAFFSTDPEDSRVAIAETVFDAFGLAIFHCDDHRGIYEYFSKKEEPEIPEKPDSR